jgi:hypothetical protein
MTYTHRSSPRNPVRNHQERPDPSRSSRQHLPIPDIVASHQLNPEFNKLTLAVLSNPFIELKTTSIALGSTPLSALFIVFPPDTEYVFPELLTP